MTINYFAQNSFASNHFASDQLAGGAAVGDGCYFGSYQFQANYFGNYYFCGEGVPTPPTPSAPAFSGGGGGGGWNCFPGPTWDGMDRCGELVGADVLERFNSWRSGNGRGRKVKARRKGSRVKARMLSGTKRIIQVERREDPPRIVVEQRRVGIGGILLAVAVGAAIGYFIAKFAMGPRKRGSRRRR